MPSLTRHEVDFSPELSLAMKVALLNRLDKSWRESEPFEVEIEIPSHLCSNHYYSTSYY